MIPFSAVLHRLWMDICDVVENEAVFDVLLLLLSVSEKRVRKEKIK